MTRRPDTRTTTKHSTRRKEKRPALFFPGAARIEACRVLCQEDGTPALFLRTLTTAARPHIHRLPEGVRVSFEVHPKGQGFRAVFSSPGHESAGDAVQFLDLSEGAYTGFLEGLACLLEARQTIVAEGGPLFPSEDLPPKGHALACVAVIQEASGPALYFGTTAPNFTARLYRVGKQTRVNLEAPHPLPPEVDKAGRAAMLKGRVILETPAGRAVLSVPMVSTARTLLEALHVVYGEGKKGAA